jgi:hypothetical protein
VPGQRSGTGAQSALRYLMEALRARERPDAVPPAPPSPESPPAD